MQLLIPGIKATCSTCVSIKFSCLIDATVGIRMCKIGLIDEVNTLVQCLPINTIIMHILICSTKPNMCQVHIGLLLFQVLSV